MGLVVGRALHGARGLKRVALHHCRGAAGGRALHGARGLKQATNTALIGWRPVAPFTGRVD